MQFTADAVEHSEVTESNGELHFTTPEEFQLALNEKDILKVVQKVAGRPMRVKIALGEPDRDAQLPKSRPPPGRRVRARAGASGSAALPGDVPGRAGPRGAKSEGIRQDI